MDSGLHSQSAVSFCKHGQLGNEEALNESSGFPVASTTDDSAQPKRPRRHLLRRVHRRVCLASGTKSASLVFFSCCLLLTSVGNAILFKKITTVMPNYSFFLSQLICFAYVPIFGVVVMMANSRGAITESMHKFPKHHFASIGLMDGLVCLMCIVGGAFTSGPTQLVLSQTVIPCTLFLATVLLGQRFHGLQYIGAVVIIAGVVTSKLPSFFFPYESDKAHDVPIFNIIYAASALPGALSTLWKEVAFTESELDVNYMQFWVAVFQVLVGFVIAPLNSLPLLGPQRIPLNQMHSVITRGSACLFAGKNFIVTNCGEEGKIVCDTCEGAWVAVAGYLAFNILYNVFTLHVVKQGGAALSFVIATLRLPLTTMCFYSSRIVGEDAIMPSIFDFLGLVVLVLGLAAYRWGSAIKLQSDAAVADAFAPMDLGVVDAQALLPDDEKQEVVVVEEDEIPIASLMMGAGPYILQVHRQRTRHIYWHPVRLSPHHELQARRDSREMRLPQRRTLHDFRNAHIQKIEGRRSLFGLPGKQENSDFVFYPRFAEQPLSPLHLEDSDYEDCCSDGSVNSLTVATRPHPFEPNHLADSEPAAHGSRLTSREHPRGDELARNQPLNALHGWAAVAAPADAPKTSPRMSMSVMLRGGLDLTFSTSPRGGDVENRQWNRKGSLNQHHHNSNQHHHNSNQHHHNSNEHHHNSNQHQHNSNQHQHNSNQHNSNGAAS